MQHFRPTPVSLVGYLVGYIPPVELKQEEPLCPHT
jgi:hypothetical protein